MPNNNLQLEYEGLQINITFDPATNRVSRSVTESGAEIYRDELIFDKSVVASFELKSAEEQAKIVTAWGAAGIQTRIEDGQIGSNKSA